jgi:hypothetical protein
MDVLRHIIKNVSKRLVRFIWSGTGCPLGRFFFRPSFFSFKSVKERIWKRVREFVQHRRPRGQTLPRALLVQMEEEERAIRAMPFVTTLSFVRAVKGKAEGWRVTLTCFACREYNSCGKKQEASVHISGERPTLLACLQELRKRLATALKLLLKKMLLMPSQLLL